MVSIQVNEQTAQLIQRQAAERGLTVAQYLQELVPQLPAESRPGWDELEEEILSLSTAGGTLPADFRRADIYCL